MVGACVYPRPPRHFFHLQVYIHDRCCGDGFEFMELCFHEYTKLAVVEASIAQYLGHPLSHWWGEHHEGLLQPTQTQMHMVKDSIFDTSHGDENLLARVIAYSDVVLICYNGFDRG